MEDESDARIDNPEMLCDAIVGIIDELETGDVLDEERAAEFRSDVYRSIDIYTE